MKLFYSPALFLSIFIFCAQPTQANNAAYDQRRNDYIDTALAHFGNDAITLQAYRGVPVDTGALNSLVRDVVTSGTADFDIVKLIRVLFYSNGEYDTVILPTLNKLPFWLTNGDTLYDYWSENHMCMWMSADWLLHEKYNKPVDSTLSKRIRHYLHLKVKYGFYEVFSSVYGPYCLSGLLNLADFSQDAEIKSLATQAAQRLLHDMLLLTNDKGVFYPIAGRNYYGKYLSPYGQNHNNLIWLLTGMGQMPGGASHAGGCLASSTLPVDSIISSWSPMLDTSYYHGHTLDSGFVINDSLYNADKVIFQWSSGGYFHPDVALQTFTLLTDSNMWNHIDFKQFAPIKIIDPSGVTAMAQEFSSVSESSVISGDSLSLFKHNSVTLASMHNFWPGKVGYQEFPCVANVGTTPVMTGSGQVMQNWDNRNADMANEHLPYVEQKHNVALLMYWPEKVNSFFKYTHKQVALLFIDADYDEVREDSLWILGRQGNSYVGVRRHCLGYIDSVRACENIDGQAWVIMVGDSSMYGSFNNFQSILHASQFQETWHYDSTASQEVYFASITVDSTNIAHTWKRDSTLPAGIHDVSPELFSMYPNPANNQLTIDLSSFSNQSITVQVNNMMGQRVFEETKIVPSPNLLNVNTGNWQDGIYLVSIITQQGTFTRRLVKSE